MVKAVEAMERSRLEPPPLRITRTFHAPRRMVFKAWCSADHVSRWFGPNAVSIAEARVEARVGGPFEVCMRGPDGQTNWARGVFLEVVADERLVIDLTAADGAGRPLFKALTEVRFSDAPAGGARLDIVQTYALIDPETAAPMVAGAEEGWRETLDKLAAQVVRHGGDETAAAGAVAHATFHLERTYDAPVERVWRALTDPAAKSAWFTGSPEGEFELIERATDVRPGGRERLKGRWEGKLVSTFDAIYHDVIENVRLVYSYEMRLNDQKISVSLATMELSSSGARTSLRVTEQGAFLDGYDDAGERERGTGYLLDALGASLTG